MADKAVDSVKTLKKKLSQCKKAGKEKVEILNKLAEAYWSTSPKKSIESGNMAFDLCETLNYRKGKAEALKNIGGGYYYLSNYDEALEYYLKSLKIYKEIDDKNGIASCVNNIGNIYFYFSNYDKALKYLLKALKIYEEIGDKKRLSVILNNIGNIYDNFKNYDKALKYFQKALEIRKEIDDKEGIAASIVNIGIVFWNLKNINEALEYFQNSLKIYEEIENQHGIAISLINLGNIYWESKDYNMALKYFLKSLKEHEEIGNKRGITSSLINIGSTYVKFENYSEAFRYLERSLKLAEEIEAKDLIMHIYDSFSELYSAKRKYKKALEYYKLYSETKDSIFTEESSKKIAEMQTKYETEKKEKEAEIFRLKNVELVKANNKLKEANKKIAEKNEHIMSSIRYAERIQNAILPLNEKIKKSLPEHFIIFKPRDIVSGDFYWFNQIEDKIILAVVDCTGHGVPGAFMSMIGNTILNELINEKHILDPALILENLHTEVRFALKQETGETESTDGMDVCLCVMEPKKHKLTFSGAKRPLYFISNSTLTKIKGDRKTIGGRQKEEKRTFTTYVIEIQEGDAVYLTSDGFADQSDVEEQKFGSKRLENLLLNISTQSCKKQKQKLLTELKNHSGKEEQRDDITIIGIGF